MWSLLLAAFIASAVIAEEHDICSLRVDDVCEPPRDIPDPFPENEEQMEKICPIAINLTDCLHNHDEVCKEKPYRVFEPGKYERIREVFTGFCDKESTFYKALVPNLKCIKISVQSYETTCGESRGRILKSFERYTTSVSSGEYIDSHEKEWKIRICLSFIYHTACVAADAGRRCNDTLAKDSVIEFRKRMIGITDSCSKESFLDISSLVQIVELEEEEKNMIIEILAKFSAP